MHFHCISDKFVIRKCPKPWKQYSIADSEQCNPIPAILHTINNATMLTNTSKRVFSSPQTQQSIIKALFSKPFSLNIPANSSTKTNYPSDRQLNARGDTQERQGGQWMNTTE